MITKIAWRNILRNKRRSIILTTSIVVGVFAAVLTDAFSTGMMEQMLTNQIGSDAGYLQIHKIGYYADPTIQNAIANPEVVDSLLNTYQNSLRFSKRIRTFGIVSSAYNSSGVSIVGIIPSMEKKVTTIWEHVIRGEYLSSDKNQILISSAIAVKLHVNIGDKVVIMASRLDGSIGSAACRITGIYETFDSGFDQTHVYVPIETAREMLNTGNRISEFVINPIRRQDLLKFENLFKATLGGKFEVLNYRDMLPLFVAQIQIYNSMMIIIYLIIAVALLFGVIDTMMMAVMERTHEFGVDMAIGMSNARILEMVLLEAFFIGIIGTAIGTGISYLSYLHLAHSGLNLAIFSQGLRSFGLGAVIYPVFDISSIVLKVLIIPLAAVAGGIYPAVRATKLNPVDAIRRV